jgi:hypothetical protein
MADECYGELKIGPAEGERVNRRRGRKREEG